MDQIENIVPDMENDPAAEFLVREEIFLADIENENGLVDQKDNDDDDDILQNNNHNNEIIKSNENYDMINSNGIHYDNASVEEVKEESENICQWREEQKLLIQKKDEEEEIKNRQLLEQAKTEIKDWYESYEVSISKMKTANRNAEKELITEINKIDTSTQWERIANLCDFNTKINKTDKDVSRMRSIILQLKQN